MQDVKKCNLEITIQGDAKDILRANISKQVDGRLCVSQLQLIGQILAKASKMHAKVC